MPQLIKKSEAQQSHPLYKKKNNCNCSNHTREKSLEKTESIPKTYDAIKEASGASMKLLKRK